MAVVAIATMLTSRAGVENPAPEVDGALPDRAEDDDPDAAAETGRTEPGGDLDDGGAGSSDATSTDEDDPEPTSGVDLDAAVVHPASGDGAPVIGIAPDGSTLLSLHGEDRHEVCVRDLEDTEPRGCIDAGMTPRTGWVWWADDGSVVALGDDSLEVDGPLREVVLIDVASATATTPLDATPVDEHDGGEPFVAYANPAPSPDGSELLVERRTETGSVAVHVDLATGEERELGDVGRGTMTTVWSPDGATVWVSYADEDHRGWVLGADLGADETDTLDPTVDLGDGRIQGWLVQVSEDGGTGLLLLPGNALHPLGDENIAILAVMDLATGQTAPALPHEPGTDRDTRYAGMRGGRLSADGSTLTLLHQDVPGDEHPDADLQVVQVSVASVLDGSYDQQVLVDGLGARLDLELPLSVMTATWFLFDPLLPAQGTVLTVPVTAGQPLDEPGEAGFATVDHYVRLPASFDW